MTRNFFRPPSREIDVVVLGRHTIAIAQRQVIGCTSCSEDAGTPFDWVLDYITGRLGSNTEYVLEMPASCSKCGAMILEKTFVKWDNPSE